MIPVRILLRTVARSFYRLHAGLFLVMFILLFGIMQPSQWYSYQKNLLQALMNTPVFYCVVFAVWFIYVLKVLYHTRTQLASPQHQFLFYSVTSFTKRMQFRSWFSVQLVMLIPVVGYGLVAACIGLYHHYFLQSAGILIYLIILAGGSAYVSMNFLNNPSDQGNKLRWSKITAKWPKPFRGLYLRYTFYQMKLPWLVTKIFSFLIIAAVSWMFPDESKDPRIAEICMLTIIVAHAILIYREFTFEHTYLTFMRNMPYRRGELFFYLICFYFLILLPEGIWLFNCFDFETAVALYFFGASIAVLFHVALFRLQADMRRFLKWVFVLSLLLSFLLKSGLFLTVMIGSLIIAFLIFHWQYYRRA